MKKLIAILIILLLAVPVWAAEDKDKDSGKCPKTLMQKDCFSCHIAGNFRVKETAPDAHLVYPVANMKILDGVGYYFMTYVDSDFIKSFFSYLDLHKVRKAIIEIHSSGGPLFEGQRIVGLIRDWQSSGGKVTTKLYAKGFSAGFLVFISGDVRLVDEYGELMWHEIQSFEGFGFKVETPSDKEDAAKVLRHLQDVLHEYLATRGKLTKEEIDQKVSKRQEWWMSGKQAVEYGLADGFIAGK
ncbi:MAG: ATP-dependent Clp protease proteolytic subunit [Pseudomonadota bacterium]